MKSKLLIISIVLFTGLCCYGQKNKPSSSHWNGNGKEELNIPTTDFQFFKKGQFYYYLSNDKDNIYLDMRIDDAEAQNKILKQGLTIWLNTDNKQLKKSGIRFPIGSQNPVRMRPSEQGAPEPASANPNSPIAQATMIELTGFTKEERRIIPANSPDNFHGSVHYNNDGVLIYRLVIPVSRIETDKNIGSEPVALGIEPGAPMMMGPGGGGPRPSGGVPSEFTSASGRPSGGGGGGSRSSRGGGSPPAGPSGFSGGGAPPSSASQGVILWVKDFTLAPEK